MRLRRVVADVKHLRDGLATLAARHMGQDFALAFGQLSQAIVTRPGLLAANFLHCDAARQGAALRLFLRPVEQRLPAHSPRSGPAARHGAVAVIHRFGSTPNAHLHFHCVVIDGLFDAAGAGGIVFHAAAGLDAPAVAAVQAGGRRCLLRVFVRHGLLPGDEAQAMGQ